MNSETTARGEGCLYGALAVCVVGVLAVSALGEWVILALASLVALALLALVVWGTSAFTVWVYRTVAFTKLEIEQKRQSMAIQAAVTRQQLLLEDKRSHLVYAQDGFLPVAYNSVMDATNGPRLLDLAAQRIDTLRLPENVPNHLHIVTTSDTEQTLNQGANVPSVTGSLGDLSFLLPGGQSGKYQLIEEAGTDDNK